MLSNENLKINKKATMCLSIAVINPEKVLSQGEHAGFEFMTLHNGMGYRCGYVRVPKGHPWHGKTIKDDPCEVHGGITFAESDKPCEKDGPDDAWWLGFDCAHAGDAPDPKLPGYKHFRAWDGDVLRDQAYVDGECRHLCERAAAAV